MGSSLATLVYAFGIAGLFFLDRDKSVRTSKALWLPVIWLWINGSRAVGTWLNITPTSSTDLQLDGSPLDRVVFSVLLAAAIVVLVRRGRNANIFRRIGWPVLAYLAYCLVSCIWSDFPDVAAKRWIKAIGDLAMVLVIVTDGNPTGALKRVFSRVGFVLFPASVLLIKYFPQLGRSFDVWEGTPTNTGVTTNKNSLGVIVFVISLGALWSILTLLRSKNQPNRGRHLLAQATVLAFGIALLVMANSVTSRACFGLGAVLMLAASWPAMSRRPWAIHALVLMMVLTGILTTLFGVGSGIVHAMGRKADLTGRTDIWRVLIPMAPNPIVGAGFESFWLGPRVDKVWHAFEGNPLNEAHNGYIETYLNLGYLGVGLIVWILISGYRRAAATFRRDPLFGSLLLSYVATSVLYSVTEAGFRMLLPLWFFLLFAVVAASRSVSDSKDVTLPRFWPTD